MRKDTYKQNEEFKNIKEGKIVNIT